MFWLGVGVGLVGAFVVMVLAGCAGAAFVVRVDQRRLDQEPIPQLGPSTLRGLEFDPADEQSAKKLRQIERGVADHDKYLHALEAISTLSQDVTAQRVARQALEKGWKST